MPLIVVTGYPKCGKTYRSKQLQDSLNELISTSNDPSHSRLRVHMINDESLGLKSSVYANAKEEKDARASEMSAIKRLLSKDDIVIADGLNYIKGFRYQLFCESKALSTPSCVVHVGAPVEICRKNNDDLRLQDKDNPRVYTVQDFDNLIFRYEEPNPMTRWDSPYFTILWDDEKPPVNDIWDSIITSSGSKKLIKPHAATVLKPATQQDYLYELDKITSDIVSNILSWQKDHTGEVGGQVKIDGTDQTVNLPISILTLPSLQRIRRQFITLNRQHTLDKGRIQPLFVDYLNDQFE